MNAPTLITLIAAWFIPMGDPPEQPPHAETHQLAYTEQEAAILYEHTQRDEEVVTLDYQPGSRQSLRSVTRIYSLTAIETEGTTEITESVESVRIDLAENEHKLSYDSDNPDHTDVGQSLAIDVIKRGHAHNVHCAMSPAGDALRILNPDQLTELVSGIDHEQGRAYVGLLLSDKHALHALRSRYFLLPEEPVKVGDNWSIELELPQGETYLRRNLKLELTQVEQSDHGLIAQIAITGKDRYGYGKRFLENSGGPDGPRYFKFHDIEGELLYAIDRGIIENLKLVVSGSSFILPPYDPDTLEPGMERPELTTEIRSITTVRRLP